MPAPASEYSRDRSDRYEHVWILAQDPSVRSDSDVAVTARVRIPKESWRAGPRGSRAQVVDYDASAQAHYSMVEIDPDAGQSWADLLPQHPTDDDLRSHKYHACNVFAVAMATIAQFERALGRRVWFATDTHQIKLAPHAFRKRNAFYSRSAEAVAFGYFQPVDGVVVDTCLSYDIIVHELTHAILDGLRQRFVDHSSAEQAAFHEAFADVVALLSSLSRRELVEWALGEEVRAGCSGSPGVASLPRLLDGLRESVLIRIAPEFGAALGHGRSALRNSIELANPHRPPDPDELREPHRLGETLVAAILLAFHRLLKQRLNDVVADSGADVPIRLAAKEAAAVADELLTICIQAIDYTPPVHIDFGDYLSALLTVYSEFHDTGGTPDIGAMLLRSFEQMKITPNVNRATNVPTDGWRDHRWTSFDDVMTERHGERRVEVDYRDVRFEQIQTDRDEAFRFVFANLEAFELDPEAYTRVLSVRPSIRVSPDDGFTVRETVIECVQRLQPNADELRELLNKRGHTSVEFAHDDLGYDLAGGTTIVLGDHGQVKYSIYKRLIPQTSGTNRINDYIATRRKRATALGGEFARLHHRRFRGDASRTEREAWT